MASRVGWRTRWMPARYNSVRLNVHVPMVTNDERGAVKSSEKMEAVSSDDASQATVTNARASLSVALGWNTGGLAIQAVFQLTFGLLLARILGPTTYGLMAMAWITLTPAIILADAGLGLALVQKQGLAVSTIRYSFCIQSVLAFFVGIFLCMLAPRIAEFFVAPDLAEVLIVGSSILLVQAFGQIPVNLLRRRLDFRRLQLVQLLALVGSTLLVSLPLALAGFGIWSLVAGALANVATISIGAGVLTPAETGIPRRTLSILVAVAVAVPALPVFFGVSFWTISATIAINGALVATAIYHAGQGRSLQEFWRHGGYASASLRFLLLNLINAAAGALPALIIGRFFGVATLGLYDRASALIVAPVDRAAASVSNVLFSHHADLHRTGMTQTNLFLRSLSMAFLAGIPFAVGVVENGSLIVDVALGAKWLGVVPLVAPLAALAVLVLALQAAVPVLNGRGRPEVDLVTQLASIVLFLIAVAFVAHDETTNILWALVAAYGFRVLCLLIALGYLLAIRLRSLLISIVPGGFTAILALAANRILSEKLPSSISEPARLAAMIAIYALMLLLAWFAYRTFFCARLFGGSHGRAADDALGGSFKDR